MLSLMVANFGYLSELNFILNFFEVIESISQIFVIILVFYSISYFNFQNIKVMKSDLNQMW